MIYRSPLPAGPIERLPLIQDYVSKGAYLPSPYAEKRWVEQCKYTWLEFQQWVARLRAEHCQGACKTTNPDPSYADDLVDTYRIEAGYRKPREIWMELVLYDEYVKVVSAHRTKLKRRR